MPKNLLRLGFLMLLLCIVGCDIEPDENFQFITLEVIAADLPEAFDQNEQHNINITFRRPDGCTFFHAFDISVESSSERNIVAIGSALTQDDCAENDGTGDAILNFTALETAPYTFRFYTGVDENGNPEYLEYIVPVR